MKCLLMVRTLKEEVSRERLLLAVVARESGNGAQTRWLHPHWLSVVLDLPVVTELMCMLHEISYALEKAIIATNIVSVYTHIQL